MLVGRSMMAGFGAAHPGGGLHRCLFDLLNSNEATCSKKKSSFQDMRRMPDAPYKRDCQFVPLLFLGIGMFSVCQLFACLPRRAWPLVAYAGCPMGTAVMADWARSYHSRYSLGLLPGACSQWCQTLASPQGQTSYCHCSAPLGILPAPSGRHCRCLDALHQKGQEKHRR